ncbi:MAG: histidine kinase [Rubrivivax sp.]
MTASIIKQNTLSPLPPRVGERLSATLPDFRNLGVILRLLLLANAMGLAAALVRAPAPAEIVATWVDIAAMLEPMLLLQVLVLMAMGPWLRRLPYAGGCAAVLLCVVAIVALAQAIAQRWLHLELQWWRVFVLAITIAGTALIYFNYRVRALSPALITARLQALQARIRPHFLFNSINAVLSLMRSEPRRAESALEDMADLFRALMADNRDLIPLSSEVALCRQYLNLEMLRLGERLQVRWHVDNMPEDALVPPLILQPLIENAVYHGIQSSTEPGEISINIFQRRGELHAILTNPFQPDGRSHSGNRMAIDNIRERLALHFDAEGGLLAKTGADSFQVHIHMPYRRQVPPKP